MSDFPARAPDGEGVSFRFAAGTVYLYECPDCGRGNGGGIAPGGVIDSATERDRHAPNHTPCIWCSKGPMKIRYCDEGGEK